MGLVVGYLSERLLTLSLCFLSCHLSPQRHNLQNILPLIYPGSKDISIEATEGVDLMLDNLRDRIQCVHSGLSATQCFQCLTKDKILTLLSLAPSHILDPDDAHRISVILLYYVVNFRSLCISSTWTFPTYDFCKNFIVNKLTDENGLSDVLKQIKDVYIPEYHWNCMSRTSLLQNLNVTSTDGKIDDMINSILTNILKGMCIDVDYSVADFLDRIFEVYANDGCQKYMTINELQRLMDDLKCTSNDKKHSHGHSHEQKSGHDSDHHHRCEEQFTHNDLKSALHSDHDHELGIDGISHEESDHKHRTLQTNKTEKDSKDTTPAHEPHEPHEHIDHNNELNNHSNEAGDNHQSEHNLTDKTEIGKTTESYESTKPEENKLKKKHLPKRSLLEVEETLTESLDNKNHKDHDLLIHKQLSDSCLSASSLVDLFSMNQSLGRNDFLRLCPALLQQATSPICVFGKSPVQSDRKKAPAPGELYGYSFLAVLVISLASFAGLLLLPVIGKDIYEYLMMAFIGLAFSTLAGDALLHLIPQSLGVHKHEEEGGDHHEGEPVLWKQLGILISIYAMFLFEAVTGMIIKGDNKDVHHGHGHMPHQVVPVQLNMTTVKDFKEDGTTANQRISTPSEAAHPSPETILRADTLCLGLTSMAIVITLGDAVHNLGDGLAIGISFASGLRSGLSTSLAVFCHEVPHEIGDFVVLLSTGLSIPKALVVNGVSALSCFVGLYIGINAGDDADASQWIMAITAGIFIYVALADLLPELKSSRRSSTVKMMVVQNIGILVGGCFMILIAAYEDHILI